MSGRRPDAHAATPADTPRELADRRLAGRLRRRFTGSPRWLWIGNLVLLMGSAAWIVADPVLHAAFSSEGLSATDWDMGARQRIRDRAVRRSDPVSLACVWHVDWRIAVSAAEITDHPGGA